MHAVGNAVTDMRSLPAGLGKTGPDVRLIGGGTRPGPVALSVRRTAPPAYPSTNNPA